MLLEANYFSFHNFNPLLLLYPYRLALWPNITLHNCSTNLTSTPLALLALIAPPPPSTPSSPFIHTLTKTAHSSKISKIPRLTRSLTLISKTIPMLSTLTLLTRTQSLISKIRNHSVTKRAYSLRTAPISSGVPRHLAAVVLAAAWATLFWWKTLLGVELRLLWHC